MKKSRLYEEAALSVIRDNILPATMRLKIIGELLNRKSVEEILEKDGAENDNSEN